MIHNQPASRQDSRVGLVYGLSAYVMWGVFPLSFHALAPVSPLIVLCHRIIWSAVFIGGAGSARREGPAIGCLPRRRRIIGLFAAGSLLITSNWLNFIYAVGGRQTLQASLGYFINPYPTVRGSS